MTTVVVDASGFAKLVREEPESDRFATWHEAFLTEGGRILAPHIVRYELGQVLARSGQPAAARASLLEVCFTGVEFADGKPEDFAPPLTYYDAAYLALAVGSGAELVTYDAELTKAAKGKVRVVSP